MSQLESTDSTTTTVPPYDETSSKQSWDNLLPYPTRTFQLFTFHKKLQSLLNDRYKVLLIGQGQKVTKIVEALAASEALAKCGIPPAEAIYVIKLASCYGIFCPAEYIKAAVES